MRVTTRIAVVVFLLLAMPAIGQQHPNQEKGFDPTKVYHYGDIDSVNTFNGNLIVTLPITQGYRAGPDISYGFSAVFNSNVWEGGDWTDYFETKPCQRCNAGIGWTFSLGRLVESTDPVKGTIRNGAFLYESPDGRDHAFTRGTNRTITPPVEYDDYTKDESCLHIHVNGGTAVLQFPDGTKRTFTKADIGTDYEHWNLTRIEDRFGNSVVINVTHSDEPGHPTWTHETWTVNEYKSYDTLLVRKTVIEFTITPKGSDADPMGTTLRQSTVRSITTDGFRNNASATYTFKYDRVTLSRNSSDTVGAYQHHSQVQGDDYKALVLQSIKLPSGEAYSMEYNTCPDHCVETGQITSVHLPTGARHEWKYTREEFPGIPQPEFEPNQHNLTPPEDFRIHSVSVTERHLFDIDGRESVWYYDHVSAIPVECILQDGYWLISPEIVGTVTAPDNTTTATYYSVVLDVPQSNCLISSGWDPHEYGLPMSHWGEDPSGHLSTEVYASDSLPGVLGKPSEGAPHITRAGHLKRATRVTYGEVNIGGGSAPQELSSRTIFNDDCDPDTDVAHPDQPCNPDVFEQGTHYVETLRGGPDNFGHFRQISTGGDFGNGPVYRTSFTNYDGPLTTGDWMFDVYSEQCSRLEASPRTVPVTKCDDLVLGVPRGLASWKKFCFENSGFMSRQRVIGDGRGLRSFGPGNGDVLAVFTKAPTGDIDTESYYGGESAADGSQVPMEGGDNLCSLPAFPAVSYAIQHTYSGGVLKSSQYVGASFKSVDRDIDEKSGLVWKERDSAGNETTFDYDVSGRLVSQSTPGLALIQYAYTPATLGEGPPTNAFVTSTQTGTTAGEKKSKFIFDGFGRVIRELSQADTDDGTQRGHDTNYDAFGRKLTETVTGSYASDAGPVPAQATRIAYDFSGRAKTITPPRLVTDGPTETRFTYFGARESDRTVHIATPDGPSTSATTKEFHDPLGRLVAVREPEVAGAAGQTSYAYDVDDHLVGVTMPGSGTVQYRTFDYDGRGFLLSEKHPEIGPDGNASVEYQAYDARGHARRRITGGSSDFDLTFDYDFAERLTMVHKTADLTHFLKSFTYGDVATTLAPRSAGKLTEAVRMNTVRIGEAVAPVLVDETYKYDELTGFLHDKTTVVRINNNDVQTFSQSFGYDEFGELQALGYPRVTSLGEHDRTVTNLYHNGYLVGVDGYSGSFDGTQIHHGITYWPNGLVADVNHKSAIGGGGQIDKQIADERGLPRPATITFTGYCVGPPVSPTEPADATVVAGHTATLSVTPPSGIPAPTYQWYRINDGIPELISGATGSHYTTDVLNTAASYYVLVGDASCTTQSRTAKVTVRTCTAIDITTQPQGKLVASGGSATLNVAGTDAGGHYQWYKGQSGDTSQAVGSDSKTLTVVVAQTTSYWVRVFTADRLCFIDSATAVVSVCANVVITRQPADAALEFKPGQTNQLSAHIEFAGSAPFVVKWFESSSTDPVFEHPGLSNSFDDATFNMTDVGTRTFHAEVFDACGVSATSVNFTLTAYAHACDFSILGLSADVIELPRSSMSSPVTVTVDPADTGNGGYEYHWFNSHDAPVGTNSPTLYAGAQTYESYYVKVSRSCTGTTTAATHTSGKVYVSVAFSCPIAPVGISPAMIAVAAGTPVTFQAVTAWPIGLHYDWYRGQTGDTREHLASVTNHPDQMTDTRPSSYWVRITNDCGLTQDSAAATLENNGTFFCKPVVITQQPQSADIAGGQTPTLSVDAISTPNPFTFSWYKGLDNSFPQQGNGNSFMPPAPVNETTTYWVQVGNGCASERSAYATLHVVSCGDNHITTQPADTLTDTTHPVTLTVAVSNPGAVTSYQWYRGASGDASQLASGTSTTFTPPLDASASYWVRMTTGDCKFDSRAAFVDVCVPPVIDHAQTDYSIQRGTGTWVSVTAHGTNLTYQWYGGTAGDITNPILNFNKPAFYVVGSETTSYWCRVSNRCDHADTPTITVSICPAIDQQPTAQNDTVMPGTTTTLTASAGGTLHWYQGELGDTSHPFGGNSATVTTPPITADTTFWLRAMSGMCGTDSNPVHVRLCTQPTVAWGSVATQIRPGDSVNLNVVVVPQSNDVTFYQGNLGDTTHPIGGGLSVTLYPTQTTTYWARARLGNCYADTSAITVSVCFPKITQQPAGSMLLNQQTPVTLSVTAQAATSYQWYSGSRDDGTSVLIPNATSSSISVAPNADTHYWVRVQGSCGFVDSDEAVITVCQPPNNLNHIVDSYIQRGQTASFSVAAATGTNLTYQWYQGTAPDTTTPIASATSANLGVTPYDTTSYWVRVTGTCGTKDSNTGTVHVCVTPSITAQPQNVTIFAGSTTTLSVTATSGTSEPLHYSWYRIDPVSGQVPAGTDSSTFTTPALSEATSYQVTVSSLSCSVDSSVVTVSMCVYPSSIDPPSGGQTRVGQTIAVTAVPSDGTNQYLFYQGASGDTSHPLTSWQAANSISVSPTVATQYWYQLKNGPCTSNSGTATVSVCIPTITSQPASVMINSGQTTTLSVTANTSSLTYQWYIGTSGQSGSPISGATSSTYTTPPLTTATNYWVLVTGSCGQVAGSDTAAVTICQPPAITQTLQGAQWIARGNSGTVWIAATGTNLTYQWYTGTPGNTAAPVAGATTASVSVSPQNTTNYWCRVSGTCGSQDSIALTVNVCAAPVITTQPQSASVFSGGSTTLSVAATEATTSPVMYQWYQGSSGTTTTPISGATSTTFTTPTLTTDTSYWVRVSCGTCNPADSQTATVSICPYPATVSRPSDAFIAVGQTTRLSTIPQNGSSSNTYRWYRGASLDTSNPVTGWQSINYFDANPTVTTQYWAQVQTGSCVTRTLATTVNVCIPTITTQPASLMINPGASTTLTVVANTSGLTYQWYTGTSGTTTSPINGATGSSLTITPSVTTSYWVKVTGTCSQSVNSNTATVTVCQVPTITGYTPSASISRGSTATLSVTASGTNLTYQWYVGTAGNTAAPISGGTNASIALQPNDNTNYWCRVSGTCGTRDSATIPISVCTTPTITTQPQSVTIFAGSSTTLSVTAASGTSSPISYQWFVGTSGTTSSPINGATSASYNTGAVSSTTNYWVRVSCGVCTPADSATATVSMCAYPSTLSSPGDSQVTVGQSVRLFGVSYASGNLYRWYAGASGNTSTPVSNWSSNNYVDVSPTVTTSYWYQLQNVCTSNSAAGTLYVCVPTFTQQPQNVTIVAGSSTTLTATANTAGVTYQWYVGASGNTASPISGATGSSVTVSPASTTSYWVRAWSTCSRGTDSNAATVTVCTIPVISRQPGNATPINPGWAGTTDVIASGANLTYQWYRGESGDTSSPISGATGSSVTVSTFSSLRVWVRVTNLCGFVNSNAAWISVYPTISGPTQSTTTLSAGSMATVSVSASGTSLHYDWRLNGSSVGTDSPTLNVQINTGGSGVTCDVTSGIATSHSQTVYFDLCNGLYIYGITTYPQPNGCKTLGVNVDQPQWVQSVDWYQGPRGDTSHPVTSWPVCPTTATQYWARVHNWDDPTQTSCYTDSQTITLP